MSKKILKTAIVAAALVMCLAQPAFANPDQSAHGPEWLESWVNWAKEYGGGDWRTLWLEMWLAENG